MTTSQYAYEVFGDFEYAKGYGDDQVRFSKRNVLEEFFGKALQATLLSIMDDVKAKHAAILDGDPTSERRAFVFDGGQGLSVNLGDGRGALIAWWMNGEVGRTAIVPWHSPLPAKHLLEVEHAIAAGPKTFVELEELATRVSHYGGLPVFGDRHLYSSTLLTLDETMDAIAEHGIDMASRRLGIGLMETRTYGSEDNPRTRHHGFAFQHRDVDVLDALSRIFQTAPLGDEDFEMADYRGAVHANRIEELYRSVCAMVMETNMEAGLSDLTKLIELGEEIGLSKDTCLAYNDLDRRVHIARYADCDVHVHNNIDLNEQNVFVTVLKGRPGRYEAVDVYIASSWYRGDERELHSYDEDDRQMPIDHAAFYRLVDRVAGGDGSRISENDIHRALAAGQRPDRGRVLSHDIVTGSTEFFPALVRTGYLTYFDVMVEPDLEIVRKVADGETDLFAEFQRKPEWSTDLDDRIRIDLGDKETFIPAI